MAETTVQGLRGYDAVERDQEDAERFRRLRLRQRLARLMRTGQEAKTGAVSELQQAQQLLKKAKNFKAIFTAAGAATSLTIIGIIWTLIQWNVQMVWTVFGLPGKDYIGLPFPYAMVPLVIFIDLVMCILLVSILLAAYFFANPKEAACKVLPEVTKYFLGNGILNKILVNIIEWSC